MHVPAWPVLPSSTLAPDAIRAKFASRTLAGIGVMVCDELGENCFDDGTGDTSPNLPTGTPAPTPIDWGGPLCPSSMMQVGQSCVPMGGATLPPVTSVGGNAGYTVPAQNSAQWGALAAQLLKSGLTLAQIQAIQPGTVVSANGAILRQNPGFGVPVANTSTNFGLSANTSTTTLLVAGLAVVAVLFASRGGGR